MLVLTPLVGNKLRGAREDTGNAHAQETHQSSHIYVSRRTQTTLQCYQRARVELFFKRSHGSACRSLIRILRRNTHRLISPINDAVKWVSENEATWLFEVVFERDAMPHLPFIIARFCASKSYCSIHLEWLTLQSYRRKSSQITSKNMFLKENNKAQCTVNILRSKTVSLETFLQLSYFFMFPLKSTVYAWEIKNGTTVYASSLIFSHT